MELAERFTFRVKSNKKKYIMIQKGKNTWCCQDYPAKETDQGCLHRSNIIVGAFERNAWIDYTPIIDKWDKLCQRMKKTAGIVVTNK
jgi:hypothetical protein